MRHVSTCYLVTSVLLICDLVTIILICDLATSVLLISDSATSA